MKVVEAAIREINEEIGITLKYDEAQFLGTIQKENYFRDIWKFKKNIKDDEIKFNDGEVTNVKWVTLNEYKDLYEKKIIVPSGDFVIKFLDIREKREEIR